MITAPSVVPCIRPLEQRDLALVLVQRRAEDEAHVLLVERLSGAADELREIGIVNHWHRGADQARPAAERPRALRFAV